MNNVQDFNQFLSTQAGSIDIFVLVFNIILSSVLAGFLSWFYIKYGTSQSNRHSLANIFVLLTVTTTLVITIVKSSLALSLGLVGALSIVRFRAAIKEPEELAFLFLAIAIGLGFGADQRLVTSVSFGLALLCYFIYRHFTVRKAGAWNFFLTASAPAADDESMDKITEVLSDACLSIILKRHEKAGGKVESVFYLEFENYEKFDTLKKTLDTKLSNIDYLFVEDVRVI